LERASVGFEEIVAVFEAELAKAAGGK